MNTHSRKERMALLLQEIVDEHIAPESQNARIVTDARDLLQKYWTSRDATRQDQWDREPDWLKKLTHPKEPPCAPI